MSRDVCIHTWPCTYYLEPERRWVTGQLSLTSLSLRFVTDSTGETLVSFPLSSIVEIKKEASHFIFSSITVLEKGHAKHWFSSLRPSRNVVFSIIEHFWRELLLSQPAADVSAPRTRGKELTGLMAGSQKRLEDTARVLHHQGQQLDGVMRSLDKMESDLEVADRLLTELESPAWWPFSSKLWKTPSETKPREGVSVKPSSEPFGKEGMLIQIPAIISHRTESHVKPGRLTVLVSGLEIHDSGSLLMHRFEREDVDDIKVHSPYEISIRQRFIGKPDVAYRLISAKMPEALPILEVQFSKKLELLEDALVLRSRRTSSPTEKSRSVWHADARPCPIPPRAGGAPTILTITILTCPWALRVLTAVERPSQGLHGGLRLRFSCSQPGLWFGRKATGIWADGPRPAPCATRRRPGGHDTAPADEPASPVRGRYPGTNPDPEEDEGAGPGG
nr:synaptosomal-associated protein 47 isoform X1 [Aotus nancymaae]